MTTPDKLTVADVEAKIQKIKTWGIGDGPFNVWQQLLDTMRENDTLRNIMLEAHGLIAEGEIFEATALLKINAEHANKDIGIKCPPDFYELRPGVYISGDDPTKDTHDGKDHPTKELDNSIESRIKFSRRHTSKDSL